MKEFPNFTFHELSEFLGENPISRVRMVNWHSFDEIFNILWSPNPRLGPHEKRKWNPKYLRMCHKALDLLGEHEDELDVLLGKKIKALVEYYCPVLPSVSLSKWLAPDPSRKQPAWLGFKKGEGSFDGSPYHPNGSFPCEDVSWWETPRSIHWDALGKVKVQFVGTVSEERDVLLRLRELREGFTRYGGEGRELVLYPGESQRVRRAWFRKARELQGLWKRTGGGMFPFRQRRVRRDIDLF